MKKSVQDHHNGFQDLLFFSLRGQAVAAEFVVILLIVIGALTAMTVYARRTIQARAYDAQTLAIAKASKGLGQTVLNEYEPYYTVTGTKTDQQQVDSSQVLPLGDYRKDLEITKKSETEAQQNPPETYVEMNK
jgi:hypothetical protein